MHLEFFDFTDPHAAARTADSLWFAAQQQEHQNSAVYLSTPNPSRIANNTIATIIDVSVRKQPNALNLVDTQHRETIPPTATSGCG